MARWQAGARERLEQAALELFSEQGFAATTVPQITARAGLTTRTFFRHFADKREVLFAGEEQVPAHVERLMAELPAELSPAAVLASGLEPFATSVFGGRREHLRAHRAIIDTDAGLREREYQKMQVLTAAIQRGFVRRGADELTSALAAEMAITVIRVSLARWLRQDSHTHLSEIVAETLGSLRALTANPSA